MIRKRPCALRVGFVGLVIAVVLASATAAAEDETASSASSASPPTATLESVMQTLSQSGGVEARFRESRQLSILSEPIESEGRLYFAPPAWLARHVTRPGTARIIVRDDRVLFRDETGTQVLELGSSEVARAMVGNVMVLMRGDLELLREQYEVDFAASGDRWTLVLEPRDRVVRQLIERLRVEGRKDRLVRMESVETSGDVTLTEFSEVEIGVVFSPEDLEEIFSIEAAASTRSAATGPGPDAATREAAPPPP